MPCPAWPAHPAPVLLDPCTHVPWPWGRLLQVVGLALSVVGLVLVYVGGARNPAFAHGILGIIVMLLGLLQPANAVVRPHPGERLRWAWELLHKGSGRLALLLAFVNISLGVFLVLSPPGVWITWFVLLGLLFLGALPVLEFARWKGRIGERTPVHQGAAAKVEGTGAAAA
jgi:hypothetical protein